MKYFKISIKNNNEVKIATTEAEDESIVKKACEEQKLGEYTIEEISLEQLRKLNSKAPEKRESKEEIIERLKKEKEEVEKIDLNKIKGKKIVPFEGCPYKINKGFEEATKENIIAVANTMTPFPFRDAKLATKFLMDRGFEIK